jgi:hypothetical protein
VSQPSSDVRVKSYGRLEQENISLRAEVEFYQTELEEIVRAERHRASFIIRKYFGECEDTHCALDELLENNDE